MFWNEEHPALVASAPGQPDHRLRIEPGQSVRLGLGAPRTCIGVWDHHRGRRTHCSAPIDAQGTDAQCARCAFRDRGRALARDAYTDDRDYTAYLAYFGPGPLKVGLTATERGHRRLLEQGAITYTLLAHGPLEAVRAAEKAIARAGLATERIRATAKAAAWWSLPPAEERSTALLAARRAVERSGLLPGTARLEERVHDNTAAYNLTAAPPEAYDALTGLDDDAVLAVSVRAVPGRLLLADDLDTGRVLLIDSRLLAGRPAAPATGPCRGLHTTRRIRPPGGAHEQRTLF
ncbi:DUF2797 domain-containing protein [Nocardiopsis sp. CNT-189]|uniref:DUF2797 domain-containing protein n=1 Tax=Nocardiopsis oceanisediminis TaxID=2816862 RepID=UPI003B2DC686